jgi:hypothetical protein
MVDNDLNAELSAMQQIASALIRLDPAARSRALQWIQKRFHDETDLSAGPAAPARLALAVTPPAPSAPSVSTPQRSTELSADEGLSVAALDDFFDVGPKPPPSLATALLHAFAADFKDVAREWDSATHVVPVAS